MSTVVPFFDLAAYHRALLKELSSAARNVIEKGWYILGAEVAAFEEEFAAYTGVRHAIGVANGLDALVLILIGLIEQGRLRKGDGVIVPANTYIATILAITRAGLRPVLVEPDPATYNLGVAHLKEAMAENPTAVMAVHLYGRLAPVTEIEDFCAGRGLLLLEDAAQAHGATAKGRRAGAFGTAAAFSFYPSKNLGALGDGGAVTTDDDGLADILRALRNYGSRVKYHNDFAGLNSRLDELQAVFLRVKLPRLDSDNARRREIAQAYRRDIRHPDIMLPEPAMNEESHVWHQFVIRTFDRDGLARHLSEHGIETQVHYPIPPHLQPCYRGALKCGALPTTERLHKEVLSLPINPVLTQAQVAAVVSALNAWQRPRNETLRAY